MCPKSICVEKRRKDSHTTQNLISCDACSSTPTSVKTETTNDLCLFQINFLSATGILLLLYILPFSFFKKQTNQVIFLQQKKIFKTIKLWKARWGKRMEQQVQKWQRAYPKKGPNKVEDSSKYSSFCRFCSLKSFFRSPSFYRETRETSLSRDLMCRLPYAQLIVVIFSRYIFYSCYFRIDYSKCRTL